MDEASVSAAVALLRENGWTVIEPQPDRVIDGDGDLWIRIGDSDRYRFIDHSIKLQKTLNGIRSAYGLWGEQE